MTGRVDGITRSKADSVGQQLTGTDSRLTGRVGTTTIPGSIRLQPVNKAASSSSGLQVRVSLGLRPNFFVLQFIRLEAARFHTQSDLLPGLKPNFRKDSRSAQLKLCPDTKPQYR